MFGKNYVTIEPKIVNDDVLIQVSEPTEITKKTRVSVPVQYNAYAFVDQKLLFRIDACITLVLKVVVEADILVPTYGYAQIPPCQQFTQDVCTGFFDLPLFPSQQPTPPNA